jgi:ribose transport system ATP-binding protein
VEVDGRPLKSKHPSQSVRQGLAYVPADRAAQGCILSMSAGENIVLTDLRSVRSYGIVVSRRRASELVDAWATKLRLARGAVDRPMAQLSGGNQQKAVLAKWLRLGQAVYLLDEPTNGVDIGAKAAIFDLLNEAVEDGAAVLICSLNAAELAETCDRVLVLRDGHVKAELAGEALNAATISAVSYSVSDDPTKDEGAHGDRS